MTELKQNSPPPSGPRRQETLKEEFAGLAFESVTRQQAAGPGTFALGKFLTGTYAIFVQTLQAYKNKSPLVTPAPVRPIPGSSKDFSTAGRVLNRVLLGSPDGFACLSAWKAGTDISIHMERPHMFTVKNALSRATRELPVMVESLIHEIERGVHPEVKTITIDSPLFVKRIDGRPAIRGAAEKLKNAFGSFAQIIPPHYLNRVIWGIPIPLRELGVYGWKTIGKATEIAGALRSDKGASLLQPVEAAAKLIGAIGRFERADYTGGMKLDAGTPEARLSLLKGCHNLAEKKPSPAGETEQEQKAKAGAETSGAVNLYQSIAVLPVGKSLMFLTADGSPHVVRRMAGNSYQIFNGFEPAAGGTRVNGREIHGHVRLEPGDSVEVGKTSWNFLAVKKGQPSSAERKQWADIRRLPIGGTYAIGSEIRRGVVIQDSQAAALHQAGGRHCSRH